MSANEKRVGASEGAGEAFPRSRRCECGRPGCRARVSLSPAEYEALRRAGLPVLAPGHRRRRLQADDAELPPSGISDW